MRAHRKGMAQGSWTATSHMRVRASGGGAKLDFPACYEKARLSEKFYFNFASRLAVLKMTKANISPSNALLKYNVPFPEKWNM